MIRRFLLLLLLLLSNTTPETMTVHCALVPSQIPGAPHRVAPKKDATVHAYANHDRDSEAGDRVVYSSAMLPSKELSDVDDDDDASAASSAASSRTESANDDDNDNDDKPRRRKISIPRTGNLPDIHWRAIPMSHLRAHPNFRPLPPPSMISKLHTREHVRNFRQDSWQWDHLHTGRCTTSQTAAALGFLEPRAAQILGIPNSLRRGGTGAWDRLRQVPEEADRTLAGMEETLCEGGGAAAGGSSASLDHDHDVEEDEAEANAGRWRVGARESERIWIPAYRLRGGLRKKPFPFTAKYVPNLTHDELYQRKLYLQEDGAHSSSPSPMKTRMRWGNAQEATSVLTALNYFCGLDQETTVREVGMCGAGFDDSNDPLLRGVKIGASPDAIICHGNGTVEVLEVKNHCPFVWNRISPHYASIRKKQSSGNSKRKKNKGKRKKKSNRDDHRENNGRPHDPKHYLIRDFHLERRIPTAYIPQLMMEMLCVGDAVDLDDGPREHNEPRKPICTSAVMVRQTATKGAILLRLQRDEEWIREMKYYLGRFQSEFVDAGVVPPDNFFFDADPDSRYQRFLRRTIDLSESVEQVAFVDHGGVQRMVLERSRARGSKPLHHKVPLFLDCVDEGE